MLVTSAEFQKVYGLLRSRRRPPEPIEVARLRGGMEKSALPVDGDIDVEVVDGAIPHEILRPPGAAADRVLLYVHGGGFVMGSPATHRKLAAGLGRAAGRTVILPDYPLAPEAPFPAGLEAIVDLYTRTVERTPSVVVAGDSAGGGLVLALLQIIRDRGLPAPERAALLSPWLDVSPAPRPEDDLADRDPIVTPYDLAMMARWYLADADPAQPLVSGSRADPTGLAPILIQVGDAEVLYPDAVAFGEAARRVGADVTVDVWPEMIHVWQVFLGWVPEADEAVRRAGAWLA